MVRADGEEANEQGEGGRHEAEGGDGKAAAADGEVAHAAQASQQQSPGSTTGARARTGGACVGDREEPCRGRGRGRGRGQAARGGRAAGRGDGEAASRSTAPGPRRQKLGFDDLEKLVGKDHGLVAPGIKKKTKAERVAEKVVQAPRRRTNVTHRWTPDALARFNQEGTSSGCEAADEGPG